jgi:hypothetical protein
LTFTQVEGGCCGRGAVADADSGYRHYAAGQLEPALVVRRLRGAELPIYNTLLTSTLQSDLPRDTLGRVGDHRDRLHDPSSAQRSIMRARTASAG